MLVTNSDVEGKGVSEYGNDGENEVMITMDGGMNIVGISGTADTGRQTVSSERWSTIVRYFKGMTLLYGGRLHADQLAYINDTESEMYPRRDVALGNNILMERIFVGQSGVCTGSGVYCSRAIRKNELVGIISGRKGGVAGIYSVEIQNNESGKLDLDGTPTGIRDGSILTCMNEFVWDSSGNNCVLQDGGLVGAVRNIVAGSELFYAYDMEHNRNYNRDGYKVTIVSYVAGSGKR